MTGRSDSETEMTERDHEEFDDEDDAKMSKGKKVYLPGVSRKLKENEELVCDEDAYRLLHSFSTESPCLSFDVVQDGGEAKRDSFPLTTTLITGSTQAKTVRANVLMLTKITNLKEKKSADDDEEESSDSDDDEGEDGLSSTKLPVAHTAIVSHHGGINRIRSTPLSLTSNICAVWNDQAKVQIWNLNPLAKEVDALGEGENATRSMNKTLLKQSPLFSFVGHQCEGFAIDWSPLKLGNLASGDNKARMYIWQMREGGDWAVNQRPLVAHKSSIEDIQWSPTEDTVLASCSADGSVRMWDTRLAARDACVLVLEAHSSDVNVISWNHNTPLLVSGGDDGQLKVWDLKLIKVSATRRCVRLYGLKMSRHVQHKRPVATFKQHSGPITSVDWCPHDDTVFAATAEDDQTTIWDLSVEPDQPIQEQTSEEELKVAPQLLFVHMGQKEVKEVRWHRQNVGLLTTTASDGFNIFRTISI